MRRERSIMTNQKLTITQLDEEGSMGVVSLPRWKGDFIFYLDDDGWEHLLVTPRGDHVPDDQDASELKNIFWYESDNVTKLVAPVSVADWRPQLHMWKRGWQGEDDELREDTVL